VTISCARTSSRPSSVVCVCRLRRLELVLELERSFGVSIRDEETGARVLRTVNTIAEYVEANRKPA
jgi:hypothetical protein